MLADQQLEHFKASDWHESHVNELSVPKKSIAAQEKVDKVINVKPVYIKTWRDIYDSKEHFRNNQWLSLKLACTTNCKLKLKITLYGNLMKPPTPSTLDGFQQPWRRVLFWFLLHNNSGWGSWLSWYYEPPAMRSWQKKHDFSEKKVEILVIHSIALTCGIIKWLLCFSVTLRISLKTHFEMGIYSVVPAAVVFATQEEHKSTQQIKRPHTGC